ncbi:hypothetical protein J7J18_07325 [bacterium]|nr:hypothetical protein [bacterium]
MQNIQDIILGVAVLVYLWYVFIIIYHLIRFGIGVYPKVVVLAFFLISVFLLMLSLWAWSRVNWDQLFDLIKKFLSVTKTG